MHSNNEPVLTIDVDWSSDCVIDYVANILIEREVKATWFVTHQSEAIERLRKHSTLFELGMHPNVLPGSTHGENEDEVLAHLHEIVPNAVSMRTHGLFQSSRWLIKAALEYGVLVDVSLFLPRANYLAPHQIHWRGCNLWRIPYFWEDDSEMYEDDPIWNSADPRLQVTGLRVFDFHPVHIALNTTDYQHYERLKSSHPLNTWDESLIQAESQPGAGPGSLFRELAECLAGRGQQIKQLVEL